MKCIHYVNHSRQDIRPYLAEFRAALGTGILAGNAASIFYVHLLRGYNPDGTNRLLVYSKKQEQPC